MNALIVVLLLFLAALICTILLSVFQKKRRKMWIWSSVALLPAALIGILIVNITFASLPAASAEQSYSVEVTSQNGYLDMAFALLTQGETVGAERILNEYAAEYPVNDRYMLARARMEAMRKNYMQADGLYRYLEQHSALNKDNFSPEHNEVTLLMKGGGTYQKLFELIYKEIEGYQLPEEAIGAAECYSTVDLMDVTLTSAAIAKEQAEKYDTYYQSKPYLFSSSVMELSYLKALTIAKDYETIVERSPGYTDSHSLLILAELCRTGRISNSVLKNSSAGASIHEKNHKISGWIQNQEQSHDFGEKQTLIDNAKAMLEQTDISSPKSYKRWVKSQLLAMAESGDEKEASKLYLELARLNFDDDDTDKNAEYIQKALITAGNSEDEVYSGAASAINTILQDKDNTEGLKEIDSYVNRMVEHMTAEEMQSGFGTDLTPEDKAFAESVSNRLEESEEGPSQSEDYPMPLLTEDNDPEIGLMDSQYDDDDGDTDSDEAYEQREFSKHVTSQVNQITGSVNIASVDASKFDEVTLTVAVDESIATDAESFRKNIEIYDCNIEIKDYQVTKIEDERFNIILVCDNSGSMSGSKISDLKSALQVFVNNLSEDVKAGIVAFDSSVLSDSSAPLGSTKAALLQAIDRMHDRGGTNILDGVKEGLNQASAGDSMNIMIVMSDGQDSTPGDDTIRELKNLCGQKDVVIYSMGLGADVDSVVLSAYSQAGGGSYTYVSDSNSLLSFYRYLYGISRNRYKVTYQAQDTLLVSRKAMAAYKADAKVYDEQSYSVGKQNDASEDALGEDYEIPLQDLTVSGLDTRMLYKSSSDQTIHLLGKSLTKDKELTVSIKAGMSYDLKCEYESDTSWKITVPASAACGVYDVIVKVDGRRCIFDDGLVIGTQNGNTIRFGDYVFEASNVSHLGNEIQLSGFVRMNNWLGFTNGLTITGDVNNDSSVQISAPKAYIGFQKGNDQLNAFGKFMADSGHVINLPKIESLTLYRNYGIAASSDEFRTDAAYLGGGLMIQSLVELNAPGMRLYPDRMELGFNEFSTALPMQDQLLKTTGVNKLFKFTTSHEEKLVASENGLDCVLEITSSSSDQDNYDPVKLGNMQLYANLSDFELKLDTRQGNYSFKLGVNIAFLKFGPSIELGWKEGKFDTLRLGCDMDINTTISGVPVTFSDFKLGATDLADQGLAGMTIEGSCKISVMKVSAYLPALEKFVGDVDLLSLDDTTLSLSLGHKYIGVSTKLKLLELAELGEADIKLGLAIPYSNTLLGYDEEPVAGMIGSYHRGLKIDSSNCKIDVGAGGGVALSDKVIGLNADGKVKYDIGWWIFSAHDETTGKAFIGVYQKHNGDYVFAFIANLNDGKPLNIEWNGKAVIAG